MDSDDGKVLDGFFLVNFCYHFNHNTNCIVNYDKNEVKCQLHIIVQVNKKFLIAYLHSTLWSLIDVHSSHGSGGRPADTDCTNQDIST